MNETQNTESITEERKTKRKKWIFIVLLLLIFLLGLRQCQPFSETNCVIGLEDGEEWNGQLPQNGEKPIAGDAEGIEIPGYSQVYGPEIQLINPSNNDVYFVYKIYKDETLVYETKLIRPNHVATFNSVDTLGVGRHRVQFQIDTYDMETNEQYNGAMMNVEIINE